MRNLDVILNLAGVTLAVALAGVLLWRKTYREYPMFFAYIASSVLIALFRLSVSGDYELFFKVSWSTEALYAILAILALHEVFYRVFRSFFYAYRWFWILFPAVVVIITSIAVLHAVQHPPVQAPPLIGVILSIGVGVNVIQSAVFILFFGAVWFFQVRRRNYPSRIVDGFAVMALTGLAYELRSVFGTRFNTLAKYATSVAYLVAVLLWLYTFIQPPEPELKWELAITPQQLLEEIRQYTKIFRKFLGRDKR
jgi:hypothetical protein